MREFQLELQLFNMIAAGVVFMTKLLFMSMAVMGYFIAIRYSTELPPLVTAINIIMAVVGTFMYNFMYDAAVWMPSRFANLLTKLKYGKFHDYQSRRLFRLELESIRKARMSVGSFGTFSRTTRLEFLDFVTNQVADLLITFR